MKKQNKQNNIIIRNPKIDKDIVSSYNKFIEELRKAGIEQKPQYSISPPLGGPIPSLFISQKR